MTPAWGPWSAPGTAVGTGVCEHSWATAQTWVAPGQPLPREIDSSRAHSRKPPPSPCPPQRTPFHGCPGSGVCPSSEAHTATAFSPTCLPKISTPNLVLTYGVPPPTSQLSKGSIRVPPPPEEVGTQRGKSSHSGGGQAPHLWSKGSGGHPHGHGNSSSCGKGQLEATCLVPGWRNLWVALL